jgi:hypothetical protein
MLDIQEMYDFKCTMLDVFRFIILITLKQFDWLKVGKYIIISQKLNNKPENFKE